MIIILNISSEKFSLNGIPYFKNFMPHVLAGQLKIVNVYDSKLELAALDAYSNYSVDGVVYANVVDLQNALLPVLYTRNSLNFDSTLPFYNQITKQNGIESSGLDKTFNAGWEWLINNVQYSNATDLTISFPLASAGKERLDRVVATNLNTFIRIPGQESDSSPTADPRPDNTVDVTFVLVTDSEVGEPTPPIVGDEFITKISKSFFRMFYTGHIDSVPVDDKSYLKFEEGMLSLKSLQISDSGFLYHGRDFIFKNGTSGNVTLYHMQGTGNFRFNFPNAQDLIIKPEESVHIVMRAINVSNNGGLLDFVGLIVDLSGKADLVGGKVPASQLPSYVDDILEGYLLSNVFYVESGHTTVIPAETGKIYIDLTTGQKNKEYRYSGSTYIQITNGLIASTDDVVEGATNKYSTLALVMGYVLTGVSFASSAAITATDTILSAFGKLQKQITDNVSAIAGKQVKDDQVEISASTNVLNAWHGQTILFTANCTITVPATLNNSLMFPFRTLSGVTVTWAITTPFTWETTPVPTIEKTTGHFMRRGSTTTIFLDV
ncbi:hypothetical protein [Flavobacterium sp. 3-210]